MKGIWENKGNQCVQPSRAFREIQENGVTDNEGHFGKYKKMVSLTMKGILVNTGK